MCIQFSCMCLSLRDFRCVEYRPCAFNCAPRCAHFAPHAVVSYDLPEYFAKDGEVRLD